jgi:phospholipase C
MDAAEARERLERVNHIVVLMLENRSFDHMLGYLSLPKAEGGGARADVDGLRGPKEDWNEYDDKRYEIKPFGTGGLTKVQDPCHSGVCVGEQMAHGMQGFVANYATTRAYQNPGDVMRHQTAENVPVYDFFAEQFALCDRWFCSVPGSTWPNRLAALTGEARSKDNAFPPLYSRRSFVRSLPEWVSWRWYSSDPGSLRLVDPDYRLGHEDHFGFVEKPTVVQPHTFYADALNEQLPNVCWIDPNFVDLGGLQGANDDHPPTDVMAGQSFVLRVYQALWQSALWEECMLVIVYDEHGGFYDHVDPTEGLPTTFTSRAEFRHFGPRVPAMVVSPFVEAGAVFGSKKEHNATYVFDHTALIRTILLRFAEDNLDGLPPRVASSSHLGYVLTADSARRPPKFPPEALETVADWWSRQLAERLRHPLATVPALAELGVVETPTGAQGWIQQALALVGRLLDFLLRRPKPEPMVGLAEPNELERGVAAASKEIRSQGLPPGQP